ncbi:MAG: hypothetical protein M1838_005243 [Thelocarpon superellum]|nr:MAG: hypothetical protein M1838_005243 [Thelocarpon superellum]
MGLATSAPVPSHSLRQTDQAPPKVSENARSSLRATRPRNGPQVSKGLHTGRTTGAALAAPPADGTKAHESLDHGIEDLSIGKDQEAKSNKKKKNRRRKNQANPDVPPSSTQDLMQTRKAPTVTTTGVPQPPRAPKYQNSEPILPVPRPSSAYLSQSSRLPERLHVPQCLLLVLDLNGTLLHRPNRKQPSNFVSRPGLDGFLRYMLTHHAVMVWSSARPENVRLMCNKIFQTSQRERLVAEWGRDQLGLSALQYSSKLQVYKHLEHVWKAPAIARTHPNFAQGGRWSQHNTVLIDDTTLKAASQPHNIVEVPEFKGQLEHDANPLTQVAAYLEELCWFRDVSAFMCQRPFQVKTEWRGPDLLAGFS